MTLTTKHQRLAALRPLSPESVTSIEKAWDVRMVYESNSIQCNELTLRETSIVLCEGIAVSGKPMRDHIEAVNLSKAWQIVKRLAQPGAALTEHILCEIHKILACGIHPDSGHYRKPVDQSIATSQRIKNPRQSSELDGIMNSVLLELGIPNPDDLIDDSPNPLLVPDLMAQLIGQLPRISDPIERAAKIHHEITQIIPFSGLIGSTARLAMNFTLLAAGYPPISIPTDLRQAYYNALEAADSGDFATWQNFLNTQLERELDTWLEALEPFSS